MPDLAARFEHMSLEDFEELLLDKPEDEKWELIGGRVIRGMVGARWEHKQIVVNITVAMTNHFRARGSSCRAFDETFWLKEKSLNLGVFPDVLVFCGRPPEGATQLAARLSRLRPRRLFNIIREADRRALGHLTTREAAAALGRTPQCLRAWRVKGAGLRFIRESGYYIYYPILDFVRWRDAWLERRDRHPRPALRLLGLMLPCEAARELGLNLKTIRRWRKSGKLRAVRPPSPPPPAGSSGLFTAMISKNCGGPGRPPPPSASTGNWRRPDWRPNSDLVISKRVLPKLAETH